MNPFVKSLNHYNECFVRMPSIMPTNAMSGYKLHIYGESIEDAAAVWQAIDFVLQDYNLSAKYGTSALFEHASVGQCNKAATVYLPFRANMMEVTLEIMMALEESGYEVPATSNIANEVGIGGAVFARFELNEDLGRDVTMDEYDDMYSPAVRAA